MNPRPTAAIPGRLIAVEGENVKYSFQRIKKFFIPMVIMKKMTGNFYQNLLIKIFNNFSKLKTKFIRVYQKINE